MSNLAIKKRRLTTTELGTITPALGEVFVDITFDTLVVGDGSTPGGVPLAHEVHTHPDATTGTPGFMSATDKTKLNALSGAGGIQIIETNTTPMPAEDTLNFSTDFTLTDDPSGGRTDVAISAGFLDTANSNTIALVVALS